MFVNFLKETILLRYYNDKFSTYKEETTPCGVIIFMGLFLFYFVKYSLKHSYLRRD